MNKNNLFPVLRAGVLLGIALLLSGCMRDMGYRIAGNELMRFGKNEMAPYLLTYDDIPMVCASAQALTPLLMTFGEVGVDPNQMGVLVYMGAGLCAEHDAFDEEMRYLGARAGGNVTEAQDARIAQKRAHALAARRQLQSYELFLAYYGDPQPGKCPKHLKSDMDQLIWLLGMVSGVKAMLNDVQADGAVNVTKDIPPKIVNWTHCLKDDAWWRLPEAMRSTVWAFVPALAPEGSHPMDDLARIADTSSRQGVRLVHAIWALTAWGDGDPAMTRRAIREFAAIDPSKLDPRYRMIDAVAIDIIQGLSDRMWAEATGTRTPMGALGKFWDDAPVAAPNIDDLL